MIRKCARGDRAEIAAVINDAAEMAGKKLQIAMVGDRVVFARGRPRRRNKSGFHVPGMNF